MRQHPNLAATSGSITIQSVADVPVYQEVNARHGMLPSVTKTRRSNVTQKQVLPHAATRVATAMMLLALLGAAGCMTGRERVVSPALSDIASMTDSSIAPATSECEAFGCVP